MLEEKDFQRKADSAFDDLKRRLLTAGDEHGLTSKAKAQTRSHLRGARRSQIRRLPQHSRPRNLDLRPLTSFKLGWSDTKTPSSPKKPAKTFSKS